jgi:hypothetical protein
MNNWFVGGGDVAFRQTHDSSGITDVADLADRVAGAIRTIDPDVVTVQEGPSDIREMLLFTETYLLDENDIPIYDVFGGVDGGAQKVYTFVRRNGPLQNAAIPDDAETTALENPWESDIDGDLRVAPYEFTRRPLVVSGQTAGGFDIWIISLHTKSKYVYSGQAMWNDPERRQDYIVAAMTNRRRISSEAMRTRRYIDALLDQDQQARIVVTGDFNDGPGVDFFELRYLTHNVTDILLGSTFRSDRLFLHAFLTDVPEADRYTCIFDDFVDDIDDRPLVLDHIIVSPALIGRIQNSGINHAEYNAAIDETAAGRQREPSDHRPVFVDLDL